MNTDISIIVHGGAGTWGLDSKRLVEARRICVVAAQAGQAVLLAGGSAMTAVETAVRLLEDSPVLDAGRGSYLNAVGEVEMDALIMNGRNLDVGAVGAITGVRHPISLARHVLDDTEHAFLVGAGAEAFADKIGFPRCTLADLLAGDEWLEPTAVGASTSEMGPIGDTVGAVAFDTHGHIAAATSTGGTRRKLPGRVGDSPIVGSGAYADNFTAGVSATGHGEALMKIVISKQVCDFVAQGMSIDEACEAAVRLLKKRVNGEGGVIAISHQGQIGAAFNTEAMPHAFAYGTDEVICKWLNSL